MTTKLMTAVTIVVTSAALTACGSGTSSSSTASAAPHRHVKPRIYAVQLSGSAETPHGAPQGTGTAVIAFHGTTKVCWRFAHLHGFSSATFAHIHRGAAGKSGAIVVPLSTASQLHHRGCVAVSPATVTAIEKDPAGYYVNIHSTTYPGGAVRAQL
jgi:CHRD domain